MSKVETEATLRILLFVYNFWWWTKGESWQICLVSTDMVQIFAAKVIQGMKMLQMCQRQEATGFQKQEIKAQCETRIFNKLLPEILFSRPGLYCTYFWAKKDINVVSEVASMTGRRNPFQFNCNCNCNLPNANTRSYKKNLKDNLESGHGRHVIAKKRF